MKDRLIIERLGETLEQVQRSAGVDFSGMGVIVCDAPERLPLFPIRRPMAGAIDDDLVDRLAAVSLMQSEFHDGFHVLSSEWTLTLVSQYFSPPILDDVDVDRSKRFGGRYLAALFGSALPFVRATGIASNGFGLALFQRGKEVYFKAAK